MPLTVVVGGQYGSEGKGKVTAYLARRDNADIVLRCLPAGFVNPRTRLLLAAGALVNPEILLTEIKTTWIDPRRVGVDRNAGIVSPSQAEEEQNLRLWDR